MIGAAERGQEGCVERKLFSWGPQGSRLRWDMVVEVLEEASGPAATKGHMPTLSLPALSSGTYKCPL